MQTIQAKQNEKPQEWGGSRVKTNIERDWGVTTADSAFTLNSANSALSGTAYLSAATILNK